MALDELWASQAVLLVTHLSPQRRRFDLGPDYFIFAVAKLALVHIFSKTFIFH